ncbi:DUF1573 domain-containing protein [uncultured Bacteroides sp.]|uniref:DUF1573 domain-containing protein n=1 Tax=uncultured Bacteroides sp. TaxID=162156 RepID=UPI0025FA6202|nr:DUF1573 domain-containing protein [uncultured Bacteroides sp.]
MSIISCKHQASQQDHASSVFTAQVTFNDSIHDFGTFSSGSPIQRHVFRFVNSGNVPAVILNIDPSCRCISVEYTQKVVRPGESGKIEVTFDGTQATVGYFNKSVRIRINSSQTYTLNIKGCMKQYDRD